MLDTAFIGIGKVPEERKRVPASYIQMLVNLYTPELKDTLQNLEQGRKQYQTALLPVFEQKQRTKEEKGSLADGILIAQRNISAICLQMKSRIVSMSSNLM